MHLAQPYPQVKTVSNQYCCSSLGSSVSLSAVREPIRLPARSMIGW